MSDPKKVQKPILDGELVKVEIDGAIQKFDEDEVFALMTKAGDYLPRLQLMTSNAKKCKEDEFPVNHYALVEGKNFRDLGKEVDILVVAWRPKALEIGDNVLAVHDPADPEFKRICEKAGMADSGCMYGPEYLLYLPGAEVWVTFFMGSKSARNEAKNMRTQMKKAATLTAQKIETKKYTWFAPKVGPCSTPFDLPEDADIKEQAEKFLNSPKSEVKVDETTDDRER